MGRTMNHLEAFLSDDAKRGREMRFVPSFPSVFVTPCGSVLVHGIRELPQSTTTSGYKSVWLNEYDKSKTVHRLVAEAHCPGYAPGLQVNHIDGVKSNNHFTNLEWCTAAHNNRHAVTSGLNGSFSARDVMNIRVAVAAGERISAVAKRLGAHTSAIQAIVTGKTYVDIGGPLKPTGQEARLIGEKNHSAALTNDKVVLIRTAVASGDHHRAVAKRFGVSAKTIYNVIHRKVWRHL